MTLSEYEDHLDMLRRSVSLQGDRICLSFREPFSILLSDCISDEDLISQVRFATVKLLEELSVHVTYVALAIIQTARAYKIPYTDAEKLYNPHRIEVIDHAVRHPGPSIRFESCSGDFVGNNAVVITRPIDPRTAVPASAVRLTRPATGNVKLVRTAETAAVEVITTKSHIVLSFDGNTKWRLPYGISRTAPPGQCSRFALRHTMSADEVSLAIEDIRSLFVGLDFSYTSL